MNTAKERPPVKSTGRKYETVQALMLGEGVPAEIQQKFKELAYQTRLSLRLAKIRQKAGITQTEMGKRLGVGQSAISKLEAETDVNITIRQVWEYSQITNERISLNFGDPPSDMEAVTLMVDSIKERLERLAVEANQNEGTQDKIKGFIGEASRNILNAVALCNCKLPINENDEINEMKVEIVTGSRILPSTGQPNTVQV
jgi:transcriptional regulator with XRE-family HTH domain